MKYSINIYMYRQTKLLNLCGNILGPPRTNLMIEQVEGDIGSASSLMGCIFTLFGSIGMVLISTDDVNKIISFEFRGTLRNR